MVPKELQPAALISSDAPRDPGPLQTHAPSLGFPPGRKAGILAAKKVARHPENPRVARSARKAPSDVLKGIFADFKKSSGF